MPTTTQIWSNVNNGPGYPVNVDDWLAVAGPIESSLASPASPTDERLILQPGEAAQFAEGSMARLANLLTGATEMVYIFDVRGDVLTVQRGMQQTAPQSWAVGDEIASNYNSPVPQWDSVKKAPGNPGGSLSWESIAPTEPGDTKNYWEITGTWESLFGVDPGSIITLADGDYYWQSCVSGGANGQLDKAAMAADTQLVLSSPVGFNIGFPYYASLGPDILRGSEIIKVVGADPSTGFLNVLRAQCGTKAQVWPAGTDVVTHNSGSAGPLEICDAAGVVQIIFSNPVPFIHTSNDWSLVQGAEQIVPAVIQASNATIKIRLVAHLTSIPAGFCNSLALRQDAVTIGIGYKPAPPPVVVPPGQFQGSNTFGGRTFASLTFAARTFRGGVFISRKGRAAVQATAQAAAKAALMCSGTYRSDTYSSSTFASGTFRGECAPIPTPPPPIPPGPGPPLPTPVVIPLLPAVPWPPRLGQTAGIYYRLAILPGNLIIIPGCEPTSAITSASLLLSQQCDNRATVALEDALAAIPGSFVEMGSNYGAPRERWLVLPPRQTGCPGCASCPCPVDEDWYDILRGLPKQELPVEEQCGELEMGYCPSPGFVTQPPPPPDPYFKEGASIYSGFMPAG